MKSSISSVCALACVLAASACGDYARNNPFDPGFTGTIQMSGDTIVQSTGVVHTYTIELSRALQSAVIEWQSSNPSVLQSLGSGRFRALAEGNANVVAYVGKQIVLRTVHVVLVPATVSVSPCNGATMTALRDSIQICTSVVDSANTPIPRLATPATLSESDSAIVALHAPWVVAKANGAATIRATVLGFTDSTTVTVSQQVARISLKLNAPLSSGVYVIGDSGSSAQLVAWARDKNGYPLTRNANITFTLSAPGLFSIDASRILHAKGYGSTGISAASDTVKATIFVRTSGGVAPIWIGMTAMRAPTIGTPIVLVEAQLYDANADVNSARTQVGTGAGTAGYGYGLPLQNDTLQDIVMPAVYGPDYSYTARAVDASGHVAVQSVYATTAARNATPRLTESTLSLYKPDTTQFVITASDPQNDIREAIVVAERVGTATWEVLSRVPLPATGVSNRIIKSYWSYSKWDKVRVMIRDAAGNVSPAYANQNP